MPSTSAKQLNAEKKKAKSESKAKKDSHGTAVKMAEEENKSKLKSDLRPFGSSPSLVSTCVHGAYPVYLQPCLHSSPPSVSTPLLWPTPPPPTTGIFKVISWSGLKGIIPMGIGS
jgi:hypothetical protein